MNIADLKTLLDSHEQQAFDRYVASSGVLKSLMRYCILRAIAGYERLYLFESVRVRCLVSELICVLCTSEWKLNSSSFTKTSNLKCGHSVVCYKSFFVSPLFIYTVTFFTFFSCCYARIGLIFKQQAHLTIIYGNS